MPRMVDFVIFASEVGEWGQSLWVWGKIPPHAPLGAATGGGGHGEGVWRRLPTLQMEDMKAISDNLRPNGAFRERHKKVGVLGTT